jgi:predicted nucleic acid-binding protein
MKKKYKVYLDTNAFSGLLNTDTPGNKETIEFIFKMAKNNKIELYFSDVLLTELNNTKDKKIKDYFVNIFKNTPHVDLQTSKKDIEISNLIVERFILKKENFYDALHIACAISNKCDFIIS